MKAKIDFDENKYIKRFVTDNINGEYEIDFDNFDMDHLYCYHLVNNELVLDEDKVNQLDEKQAKEEEIIELEHNLNDTDYIIARVFEEVMSLNNPLTFISDLIKIFVKYNSYYKEQLTNRVKWRNRIEELRR